MLTFLSTSSYSITMLWSELTDLCLVTAVILCINLNGLSYYGNNPEPQWLKNKTKQD